MLSWASSNYEKVQERVSEKQAEKERYTIILRLISPFGRAVPLLLCSWSTQDLGLSWKFELLPVSSTSPRVLSKRLLPYNRPHHERGLYIREIGHIAEYRGCCVPRRRLPARVLALPDQLCAHDEGALRAADAFFVLDHFPVFQAERAPVFGYERHVRFEVVVQVEVSVGLIGIDDGCVDGHCYGR